MPLAEVIARIRRTIHELALISHAGAVAFNPAPAVEPAPTRWRTSDREPPVPHAGSHHSRSSETRPPTGGIVRSDERWVEHRQKSAQHFAARLERCWGPDDLRQLLTDVTDALDAWHRTPTVPGVVVERGSFLWRCEIADSDRPIEDIKRVYTVSRATVYRYRARYRGLRHAA